MEKRENSPALIRASELTQYSFCRRAWWLNTVKELPSANQSSLARGKRTHDRHGRQVEAALFWRRAGLFLLSCGSFFLIIALLWLWFF